MITVTGRHLFRSPAVVSSRIEHLKPYMHIIWFHI